MKTKKKNTEKRNQGKEIKEEKTITYAFVEPLKTAYSLTIFVDLRK